MLRLFSDQRLIIRSDDLSVICDKDGAIRQGIVPGKQTLDHERVSSGILGGCVVIRDDDTRLVHASAGSHIDIGPIEEAKTLRIDFLRITGAVFHDISGEDACERLFCRRHLGDRLLCLSFFVKEQDTGKPQPTDILLQQRILRTASRLFLRLEVCPYLTHTFDETQKRLGLQCFIVVCDA